MPDVLVYRHQLFVRSEPFIVDQAMGCRRWRASLCGRHAVGAPPPGMPVATFATSRMAALRHAISASPDAALAALATTGIRPDLVHAHFGVEGVYALELARRLHVPLVVTFHGFDATITPRGLLASGRPAWWRYLATRQRLDRPDVTVVCISEHIRRMVEAFGWKRAAIVTHHIGVDTTAIAPATKRGDAPILVHVARLVEVKGTIYLLRAFARCHRQHPTATLMIVGDGPLRASLEQEAVRLGISGAVTFTGVKPRNEVIAAIAGARAFCLPSATARSGASEGLGIVVLEAMASAVAVVGTRHGGIPEAVSDGETGILVPERDDAALAAALERLLADPALAERMGEAGRQRVCAHFDLRRQNEQLESIYDAALARGCGPG